jgi:hypothetical protein
MLSTFRLSNLSLKKRHPSMIEVTEIRNKIEEYCLCGLVVRVPGCRSRG